MEVLDFTYIVFPTYFAGLCRAKCVATPLNIKSKNNSPFVIHTFEFRIYCQHSSLIRNQSRHLTKISQLIPLLISSFTI